jgi:hypothetical protein
LIYLDYEAPGDSDPYWDNVVLLCHFDGVDEGTTFIDSSSYARTLTRNDAAELDDSPTKFGPTSLHAPPTTNSGVIVPDAGAFDFEARDFTIECWIYVGSGVIGGGTMRSIFSKRANAFVAEGIFLCLHDDGALRGFASSDGSTWGLDLDSNTAVPYDQWVHVAMTRSGSSWRLFQGGSLVASATNSMTVLANSSPFVIGTGDAGSFSWVFNNWIDDFRVTDGVGRYTADFTPPSAAFPDM